jgi:acetylglutamate synthase
MDIKKYGSFKGIDEQRFKEMVFSGFGRMLTSDYFEYCQPSCIYMAEAPGFYYGGAVVESIPPDISYLDKIVVFKEHRGKKIAKRIWEEMSKDCKKLVWRAKRVNPFNQFYSEECDGLQKIGIWLVYWKGLDSKELEKGINYAMGKKPTLVESISTTPQDFLPVQI